MVQISNKKRETRRASAVFCALSPLAQYSLRSEWELRRQNEILEQSSDMHNQTDQVSVEGFEYLPIL